MYSQEQGNNGRVEEMKKQQCPAATSQGFEMRWPQQTWILSKPPAKSPIAITN
jgi:hypothetical protein